MPDIINCGKEAGIMKGFAAYNAMRMSMMMRCQFPRLLLSYAQN